VTRDTLESILWHQARNLNSGDPVTRQTSMDAVLQAVDAYAEDQVILAATDHPSVTAKRRKALLEAS